MHEIVVGRDPSDLARYGIKGTGFLGKHFVGDKNEAHLTNNVRIDIARPHIIGLFGKRGTGKSYSLGTIAEEIMLQPDEIRNNLAAVIIDTMGIYWSMKTPNEKDAYLLQQWNLKPRPFDVNVLVPEGKVKEFEDKGMNFDGTFSMKPSELDVNSWALAFNIDLDSEMGLILADVMKKMEKETDYSLDDLIKNIKKAEGDEIAKKGLVRRFELARGWGLFSTAGSSIYDIVKAGKTTIVDVSQFGLETGGWSVRSLVVGLIARKILEERMKARRLEEMESMNIFDKGKGMPITWMLIDEAHQFLPAEGETAASGPLLQWVKIGREPGVSLVMATQMPNKLHQEAVSQCDLIVSHRLTSRKDIDSLAQIMQTYLKYNIADYYDRLPRLKGSAIVLDDNSERLYPIRTRPRMSWHAGGSPIAIKKED